MMLVIGLTGSIGMGKSTVGDLIRSRGIAVLDADQIVHRLYAGPAVPLIEGAFPGTTAEGAVDRVKLAAAVLGDASALARLEAIIHPLVRAEQSTFLRAQAEAGAAFAVLEVPLLFETGSAARFDAVVVVSAPAEVQRERVLKRPGMTSAKLDAILARQMPDAEKRQRADIVIDTSHDLEVTDAAVGEAIAALATRAPSAYQTHWV